MKLFFIKLLAFLIFFGAGAACAQVDEVDPSIGGVAFLLQPTPPAVFLPNSMVRVYPMRVNQLDDQVHSFPLTTVTYLGALFWLMPFDGTPNDDTWNRPQSYDNEIKTPYYYSAKFDDSLIQTEFAPTARCGFFRFTFPSGKPVVLLANHQDGDFSSDGQNAVSGFEEIVNHGQVTPGMVRVYVYGQFNVPFTIETNTITNGKRLTITAREDQKVLDFRYGLSFISIEQAKNTLEEEIPTWDFSTIKQAARDRWNQVFGQIQVEGGTPVQKRVFYTALYRCYQRMINVTEDGRYYSAFDHKVHQDFRPFYTDNGLWDTYRALEPLQTLLNPEMEADKVQSYVRMYEQSGWMPEFAVLGGNFECMTANPAATWIADVWGKGVTNFDLAIAYAGVKKNSLEGTWLPWRRGPKCSLDDFLDQHGYMPALHPGEKDTVGRVDSFERRQAVSVTEGQSYDDWCTAQIARNLGNEADCQLFLKRAANYKNVFRANKGHVWPKDADGNWIEPFDPGWSGGLGGRDYTTENDGYTFDWSVQHDLQGLFELMGGRAQAEAKLDQLFHQPLSRDQFEFLGQFPDSTGLVGQFAMGNEPSLHIPYLYDYLGAPWKTQKRVRMLLNSFFTDSLMGMPGDEDGGGVSAWVMFSMMGFYPVTPGVPIYVLGSPVFDCVTIHLHNGKTIRIICRDNSPENKYIQSIQLNGKPLHQVWFRHADIVNGATLELQMGNLPNKQLGADPASFPPSSISLDPDEFQRLTD
jgi:predicted alpha-1,2-mannosidase